MRHLTSDVQFSAGANYTEAQLKERLTSDSATVGCRFDILDSALNVVGGVGSIQASAASVSWDTSREMVGSLGMTMLANQAINFPFQYRIMPWFRIQMLDGGYAEWPMGVYVWNVPNRRNIGTPTEEWDVTLADQMHILSLAGPGPSGFVVPKGANITEMIGHILSSELGITDLSGIHHSTLITTAPLHWGITSISARQQQSMFRHEMHVYNLEMRQYHKDMAAYHKAKKHRQDVIHQEEKHPTYTVVTKTHEVGKGKHRHTVTTHHRRKNKIHRPPMPHPPHRPRRPHKPPRFHGTIGTTWYDILTKLHHQLGYHVPWFDLTGRYRATPQPNMLKAAPVKTYADGQDGIVIYPLDTQEVLTHICNRVVAYGMSANGLYDIATSDLNDLIPTHPLGQNQIGFYIDVMVPDHTAKTKDDLQDTADAELNRRLIAYNEIHMQSLAWPVHEAFDVLALYYSTDAEFSAGISSLETSWDIDLRTGEMNHTLDRITPAGAGIDALA